MKEINCIGANLSRFIYMLNTSQPSTLVLKNYIAMPKKFAA
jgi:hypothetical protein